MQSSIKRAPKPAKRGQNHKHEQGLSSTFIKKCFNHYVRMPVAKDAFKAVESW